MPFVILLSLCDHVVLWVTLWYVEVIPMEIVSAQPLILFHSPMIHLLVKILHWPTSIYVTFFLLLLFLHIHCISLPGKSKSKRLAIALGVSSGFISLTFLALGIFLWQRSKKRKHGILIDGQYQYHSCLIIRFPITMFKWVFLCSSVFRNSHSLILWILQTCKKRFCQA